MFLFKSPIYKAVQARFSAAIKQAEEEYKAITAELWANLKTTLASVWSSYVDGKKAAADDAVDSVFKKFK